MAYRLQLKRGNKSALPAEAEEGEPLFCLDTGELYMGMGEGHSPIPIITAEENQAIGGTYVQASEPTDGMASGDLWIDTNDSNTLYRYNGLSWLEMPNMGIIGAFESAKGLPAVADGKITAFYQDQAPTTGMVSGDIWVETDNANRLHAYDGSSWNDAQDSDIANAIADVATASAILDGEMIAFFGSSSPTADSIGDVWFNTSTSALTRWNETTWVSISTATTVYVQSIPPSSSLIRGDFWVDSSDSRKLYVWTGSAWTAIKISSAIEALKIAAEIQAELDSKILCFYQTSSPASTDEGDIWYDTDNNNYPYIMENSTWVARPSSALVIALDDANSDVAKQDGLVTLYLQSSSPEEPENEDLWFDTSTQTLKRWLENDGVWEAVIDTTKVLAGSGINICHPDYCTFDDGSLPALFYRNGTVSQDGSIFYHGTKSLKISATGSDAYCMMGASSTSYNLTLIPNRKWIVSAYIRTSVAQTPQIYMKTSAAGDYAGGNVSAAVTQTNVWVRVSRLIDLSKNPSATATLRIDNEGGNACNMWVDAIMVEEQIGSYATPSTFVLPADYTDNGITSDGPIICHHPIITGSEGYGWKHVIDAANYSNNSATTTGVIVVETKIPYNRSVMGIFEIDGYYHTNVGTNGHLIKSYVTFYNANTGVIYNYDAYYIGLTKPEYRLGYSASGYLCLIVGDIDTIWPWPRFNFSLRYGHSGSLDSQSIGWTVSLLTSLSGYTSITNVIGENDIVEAISPASSVESETSYGLSASVGDDVAYARADHTHGTPDAIVPGYLYGTTDPPDPTGIVEGTIYLKYTA